MKSVAQVLYRRLRATSALAPVFSSSSLFASGEQGVWYQNSDFSTLFQDAAGGTPVTGLEQPVGLRLDKRVPIGQTGYNSVYFDGTNDYLTAGASSGALGSGDFTIETWSFLTSRVNDYPCIWSNYSSFAAGSLALFAGHASATTTRYQLAINGAGFPNIQSSISIAYNQWVHLAVVRRSGVITLYVNGVADGTFSSSANLSGTNGSSWIGTAGDAVTTGEIQGSLSNLRVVVGTAVYTGNFTPPKAPLTAIAGTALLACQNTTISDNGPNTVLITAFGDTKTTLANPFGNNAFQTTNSARPVLSARVNLLTRTEEFDNAAWTAVGLASRTKSGTAPDGSSLWNILTEDTATSAHCVYGTSFPVTAGVIYTVSVYVKAGTRRYVSLRGFYSTTGNAWITFDTASPSINANAFVTNSGYESLGGGVYRIWLTSNVQTTKANDNIVIAGSNVSTAPAGGSATGNSYLGDGSTIIAWGADVRASSESSALPAYQRIGAATNGTSTSIGTPDYDTVGFPAYLRYDGGDWYQTNSINFSAGATNPPVGPELVTNGTFNTDLTGWTVAADSGGTSSWVSGAMRLTYSGGLPAARYQALSVTAGKTYVISCNYSVVSGTNTTLEISLKDSTSALSAQAPSAPVTASASASGTMLYYYTATLTKTVYLMPLIYPVAGTVDYDNVTVKELTDANYAPDKMSVFTGVRKLSEAAVSSIQTLVEFSVNSGVNNGSFGLYPSNGYETPTAMLQFNSRGTLPASAILQDGRFAAPATLIATGLGDISGDRAILRANGLQVAQSTADQGNGNYGTYTIYVGSTAGTTGYFTGREYGLVIVGRGLTAAELSGGESWFEGQTFGKDMNYFYADELTTATGDLITAADGDQIYMTSTYS